jgi:hypothetical protein
MVDDLMVVSIEKETDVPEAEGIAVTEGIGGSEDATVVAVVSTEDKETVVAGTKGLATMLLLLLAATTGGAGGGAAGGATGGATEGTTGL